MLKTISAVVVALATGIVGAFLGYKSSNREMDVKMVEIAVGILSQEPKTNIAPAREWAVDVITYYAEVKPSEEVKQALVENRLSPSYPFTGGTSPGISGNGTSPGRGTLPGPSAN